MPRANTFSSPDDLADMNDLIDAINPTVSVRRRGIDPFVPGAFEERMPSAHDLMELSEDDRAIAIWNSGVRPNTPELLEAFCSLREVVPHLLWIEGSIGSGLPANPKLYRGENRLNQVIWSEGGSPKRQSRRDRRPSLKRVAVSVYFGASLFVRLPCGCFETCIGQERHDQVLRAEAARQSDLEAAKQAMFDALARATHLRGENAP